MERLLSRLGSKTIPGLDGVRAISVALVMLFHFGFSRVPGGHGVLVFFVLSGFLITWLLLGEDERTGGVSLGGFYRRRVLRILPAFYGYFFVGLALLLLARRPIAWGQAASAAFYVANYYGATHPDSAANGTFNHIWSLAIEEQFYLLWPPVFVLLRKRPERLLRALVLVIGGIWIWRAALALGGVGATYIYHALDTRADHLLVGCATAVLLKRGRGGAFWDAVTRRAWMPLVTIALFACSALHGNEHHLYRHTVGYAVEPVLAAIAIVQVVALSGTPAWRWLELPAVAWMGRISYSLYLYQQIGMSSLVLRGSGVPVRLLACTALTFALAAGSHYLVERPFLRLKDRRSTRAAHASRAPLAPGFGSGAA